MTVNETLKAIEVMKAFTDGKAIECRYRLGTAGWLLIHSERGHTPSWDWQEYEYRVSPEKHKEMRPVYLVVGANGVPLTENHLSKKIANGVANEFNRTRLGGPYRVALAVEAPDNPS